MVSLDRANIYLIIYFITEIICNYLNTITYYQKFKNAGNEKFIDSLIKSIDIRKIYESVSGKVEIDFILQIYVNLLECFTDFGNEKLYYKYKQSVEKYSSKLSADEKSFHYSKFINYCVTKQDNMESHKVFEIELFNIYNVFLNKELYKTKKTPYLPHNLFRGILFLALDTQRVIMVQTIYREIQR